MAHNPMNVLVLTGGLSSERSISLASAAEVVRYLDPKKYNILPVVISVDGKNWLPTTKQSLLNNSHSNNKALVKKGSSGPKNLIALRDIKNKKSIDVCFIAMHGRFGEDGTIQALLDFLGIPYTGSGVLASSLGMDKFRSRQIFAQAGLKTPKTLLIKKGDRANKQSFSANKIFSALKLPVVIKPNDQGSSIGVSIVHKKSQLRKALQKAFALTSTVLVEEYIHGTEVTCAVLGNEKSIVLPVVEIVPKNEFFDYEAKYNESKCEEIIPARISPKLTKQVQNTSKGAFKLLGCSGFGRVDMIIKNSKIYVLEINTIPGLTSGSLLPKAAAAANISFGKLLDTIIKLALEKRTI